MLVFTRLWSLLVVCARLWSLPVLVITKRVFYGCYLIFNTSGSLTETDFIFRKCFSYFVLKTTLTFQKDKKFEEFRHFLGYLRTLFIRYCDIPNQIMTYNDKDLILMNTKIKSKIKSKNQLQGIYIKLVKKKLTF